MPNSEMLPLEGFEAAVLRCVCSWITAALASVNVITCFPARVRGQTKGSRGFREQRGVLLASSAVSDAHQQLLRTLGL